MKTRTNILSAAIAAALIGALAFAAPEAKAGDDERAIVAGAILGGLLGYVLHEANENHHATVGYPVPVVVQQPVVYQPRPVVVHRPVVVRPAKKCTKVVVVKDKSCHKHYQPKWSHKSNKHYQPKWSHKSNKHGASNWSCKDKGNKHQHHREAPATGNGHRNRGRW